MSVAFVFVMISCIGSYFNCTMRLKASYSLWFVSNVYFVIHNLLISEYAQAVLFTGCLLTTCIGLKNYFPNHSWLGRVKIGK